MSGLMPALADHLWQSTLAVAVAAVLVWLVRPGRPALRHAIWLGASVKFLVPFSLLAAAGEALAPLVSALPVRALPVASIQIVGEPFTLWAVARIDGIPADASFNLLALVPAVLATVWLSGSALLLALRWTRWRRVRTIVSAGTALPAGREVDAVRRVLARRTAGRGTVAVRRIAGVAAPALFGLRRAVLLWPAGLSAGLQDDEIEAVVAHEMAHFRRRDNLAALVHTVAETVFWFHPLVWWVGARLVDERERACDQEALEQGVAPEAYAGTLLNVCRFGLAVPQPLVASAAGSSLAARVEAIMDYRPERVIVRPRGISAALIALFVLGPLAAGIARAHERRIASPAETGVPTVPVQLMSPADALASAGGEGPILSANSSDVSTVPAGRSRALDVSGRDASRQGAQQSRGLVALRQVQPTYTPEALKSGIEGTVELEAVVLEDGTVGQVRIVKSLDRVFGLDEQAIRTARQWRFRPPMSATGKPVRAIVTLILDFRIPPETRTVRADSPSGQTTPAPAAPPRDPKPAPPSQEDLEFRQGALGSGTPDLTLPKVVRMEQPRYTSEAMRAKVQGSVEIEVVIGADGAVERARVIRSLRTDLDQQALNAVRLSRFEPATLDGKAVEAWVRLTMTFRLY